MNEATAGPTGGGVGKSVMAAFYGKQLDLHGRQLEQGWDGMPEVKEVGHLAALGKDPTSLRLYITFTSSLDRARDATKLWEKSAEMLRNADTKWVFYPDEVRARSFRALADTLKAKQVSQRHEVDSDAWWRIADSLLQVASPAVNSAIFEGVGDVAELRQALKQRTLAGASYFPMLAGPKVGPMWIRMLAQPGGARITGLETLPVAVDVHVRRVTENLGVTNTQSFLVDAQVRRTIQDAWRADLAATRSADGPQGLEGTSAALDPALWFFGKWGCSYCERQAHKIPISGTCDLCRLPSLIDTRHRVAESQERLKLAHDLVAGIDQDIANDVGMIVMDAIPSDRPWTKAREGISRLQGLLSGLDGGAHQAAISTVIEDLGVADAALLQAEEADTETSWQFGERAIPVLKRVDAKLANILGRPRRLIVRPRDIAAALRHAIKLEQERPGSIAFQKLPLMGPSGHFRETGFEALKAVQKTCLDRGLDVDRVTQPQRLMILEQTLAAILGG